MKNYHDVLTYLQGLDGIMNNWVTLLWREPDNKTISLVIAILIVERKLNLLNVRR